MRRTLTQAASPVTGDFCQFARGWRPDFEVRLLALVWLGYDALRQSILTRVDIAQADLDLERQVTQNLEPAIHDAMTDFAPYFVQHAPAEEEGRHPSPKAQPRMYDIAFVMREHPLVMWPLEAKVLRTDTRISEYVKAVREEFLTCHYAPFSSQAAMLGYLISGSPQEALRRIEEALQAQLVPYPSFPDRDHATSDHVRQVPPGRSYPTNFRCHHMIMLLQ